MTPNITHQNIARCPIIPVIVIDKLEDAVPLAQALLAGGLNVLEITLRTPTALEAISIVRTACSEALIGAGTVLDARQAKAAQQAGAHFAVSPGATPALLKTCLDLAFPLLPGAVTASEVMLCRDYGYTFMKFFPASRSGGPEALKALAAPLPNIQFCPTGGITPACLPTYLKLPNVPCVGGSWMLDGKHIAAKDWNAICTYARKATLLAQKCLEPDS